jgi:hypothetical protein
MVRCAPSATAGSRPRRRRSVGTGSPCSARCWRRSFGPRASYWSRRLLTRAVTSAPSLRRPRSFGGSSAQFWAGTHSAASRLRSTVSARFRRVVCSTRPSLTTGSSAGAQPGHDQADRGGRTPASGASTPRLCVGARLRTLRTRNWGGRHRSPHVEVDGREEQAEQRVWRGAAGLQGPHAAVGASADAARVAGR